MELSPSPSPAASTPPGIGGGGHVAPVCGFPLVLARSLRVWGSRGTPQGGPPRASIRGTLPLERTHEREKLGWLRAGGGEGGPARSKRCQALLVRPASEPACQLHARLCRLSNPSPAARPLQQRSLQMPPAQPAPRAHRQTRHTRARAPRRFFGPGGGAAKRGPANNGGWLAAARSPANFAPRERTEREREVPRDPNPPTGDAEKAREREGG